MSRLENPRVASWHRATPRRDEKEKTTNRWFSAHSPEAPGPIPGAAAATPRTTDDPVDVLPVRAAHVQRVRDPQRAALSGEVRSRAELVDERVRQRDESARAAHRVDNGDAVHARCVVSAFWTVVPALARETVSERISAFPRDGPPHGSRERIDSRFPRFFFRRRVVVRLSSPRRHSADPQRAPPERSAAGCDERAGDLREDGVRLNHEVDIIRS